MKDDPNDSPGLNVMRYLTASKSALLLECTRPFDSRIERDPDSGNTEARDYGIEFHAEMADRFGGPPVKHQIVDPLLLAHVTRAEKVLREWMRKEGNPFDREFHVLSTERPLAATFLEMTTNVGGRDVEFDAETHRYLSAPTDLIAGTADMVLASGNLRVCLDIKTGEAERYDTPASLPQLLTLAALTGAGAVAVLHAPRSGPPVVYAEWVTKDDLEKHVIALWRAKQRIGDGSMRPGPHCAKLYCPARSSCPTQVGDMLLKTSALVKHVTGHGGLTAGVDRGRFHLMLGELEKLAKLARAELKEDVRRGDVIDRPDGKTLQIVTKHYERLSKSSVLRAMGKARGEQMLATLRAEGAITSEPQEELHAK